MFDLLKSLITPSKTDMADGLLDLTDPMLCCAALLVHVLAADGVVKPEEEGKLRDIVQQKFELNANEAEDLYGRASKATHETVDLYGFTSTLKRTLDEEQRISLVRHLWEIVFSDGQMHEMEDNVVWRIAELLGVSSRDRMLAKQDAVRDISS